LEEGFIVREPESLAVDRRFVAVDDAGVTDTADALAGDGGEPLQFDIVEQKNMYQTIDASSEHMRKLSPPV